MILCASELGLAAGAAEPRDAVSAVVRAAADAGFDGIAVGAGWLLPALGPLTAAAAAAGLAVPMVASPLPDAPLGPGRRLPYLAALDDGDERRAAVAAFTATLEAAASLGIRTLTFELGEISLGVSAVAVARRHARDELGEGEAGARLWAAAFGERRGRSGRALDACRHALDRIVPIAERRDVTLAMEIAGHPWALPGPREAGQLMDAYRDGPLGVVWDPARLQVLAELGIGPPAELGRRLRSAARVRRANEAVGIEAGYLPGQGDPDLSLAEGGADEETLPTVPVVVTGKPGASPGEIAAARESVAARAAR